MLDLITLRSGCWSYAKLSKLAKMYGGPEEMIKALMLQSRSMGRIEMIPVIIGVALIFGLSTSVVTAIVCHFKNEKAKNLEESKKALLECYE